MPGFVVRMFVSAFAIWVAAALVPGIYIEGLGTVIAAGFLLGVVNAVVRPVVTVLTFPITLVTLGLFLLVINAMMLGLVASLLEGFVVRGLLPALLGSVLVSLVSWMASWYIGPSGRVESVERRRR